MITRIQESNQYNTMTSGSSVSAAGSYPVGQPETKKSIPENYNNQSVRVTLSEEALKKLGLNQKANPLKSNNEETLNEKVSESDQKEVEKLKARDQEVRLHERAHMMAGGTLVRKGASYQYETGPDGKRYAVGGEVSIDASPVDDNPEATIRKMQQVKRAALAPAEPSSQDHAVAAAATQKETQARVELRQQTSEESNTGAIPDPQLNGSAS